MSEQLRIEDYPWISSLSEDTLATTRRVLDNLEAKGIPSPGIFQGLIDEDQLIRLEWLTDVSHTVLAIEVNQEFEVYNLLAPSDEFSSAITSEESEAVDFIVSAMERNMEFINNGN